MKKMIPQRVLPLVMVLMMVLSFAACNATPPAASSTAGTAATASAAASDAAATTAPATSAVSTSQDTPLGKYDQPTKITWAIQTAAASKLLEKDTWEDNRWSRLIKEKLNIDLEVAFTADSSTEAYKTKLNAVIASGELPDIFKTQDMNVFIGLVSAGSLADLTPYKDKYSTPEVLAYFDQYKEAADGATFDGKLMAIPRANDNFHEAPFLWIRDDWLANTGTKAPTTIEEMVALAKTFATGDPDKNGKNGDTYGLALNKDLIRQNHGSILGLVSAFGVPGRDESQFYRDKDGKMTFSWIQPNMKPALTLLAQMYKDGLVNKEFTANNESALVEDITNGKIGMAYGSNWGTWYPYNNVWKKDGVIVHPYAIPTEAGYDYKVGIESNATGQMTVVSSTCKNPEAAFKILSLYVSMIGVDNTYWNDNEQYRLCPVYTDMASENYFRDINKVLDGKADVSTLSASAKNHYDLIVGFGDGKGPLKADDNAFGNWGQMSKQGSLQFITDKYEPDGAVVTSLLGMQRPEVWTTNVSVLDTLTITTFTDIITGVKPVEAFDTFVTDWLKNGGQQTLDEMDKLYPAK